MISFLDKWYEKLRPYLFKYKDGFFELPYLGNTPILMIESFRKMPFIKHDDNKKKIISKSPFVDAEVKYQELQDDLILIYSVLLIKSNVCFRSTYNKDIPNEYYCLTFTKNLEEHNSSKRIIYGESLENSTFQLLKPNIKIKTYHFKDANFESFQLYFKEEWLLNLLQRNNTAENSKLLEFIHSKNDSFITSVDHDEFLTHFISFIREHTQLDFNQRDPLLLYTKSISFIEHFVTTSFNKTSAVHYIQISNNDRLKLESAEKLLQEHLTSKFPGINYISQQVGLSETKLKHLFKQLYQKTLLDYYQEQKMSAAYDMLMKGNHKVTEVANHFGYSNVSKFSAMFKTYHHHLPSKVNAVETLE